MANLKDKSIAATKSKLIEAIYDTLDEDLDVEQLKTVAEALSIAESVRAPSGEKRQGNIFC